MAKDRALLKGVPEAAAILARGGICAIPTETVYGLAALASDPVAIGRVYETKGRPRFNPLIVHCGSLAQAEAVVVFTEEARKLASAFWPGPLTMILPRREGALVADLAGAGLDSLAVRVPGHDLARAVIEAVGSPLVAPSANRSGGVSPTRPRHVLDDYDGAVPVLDGGPSAAGIESTIVSCLEGPVRLMRPGALPAERIERLMGTPLAYGPQGEIIAPGMMKSHYAPAAPLRLEAEGRQEGESLLGFAGTEGADFDLSPAGDLVEAAANLFAALRQLDRLGRPIAVVPIPGHGLGEGINDRLRRAAAPRPVAD